MEVLVKLENKIHQQNNLLSKNNFFDERPHCNNLGSKQISSKFRKLLLNTQFIKFVPCIRLGQM